MRISTIAVVTALLSATGIAAADIPAGSTAPEIRAKAWFNTAGDLSLARLRGRVVVVEFWGTWCSPCREVQPKLAALHAELVGQGLSIISISAEPVETIQAYLKDHPTNYIMGAESVTSKEYGVSSVPRAFVIDRSGRIAWVGNPLQSEFEGAIRQQLGVAGPRMVARMAPRDSARMPGNTGARAVVPPQANRAARSTTGNPGQAGGDSLARLPARPPIATSQPTAIAKGKTTNAKLTRKPPPQVRTPAKPIPKRRASDGGPPVKRVSAGSASGSKIRKAATAKVRSAAPARANRASASVAGQVKTPTRTKVAPIKRGAPRSSRDGRA